MKMQTPITDSTLFRPRDLSVAIPAAVNAELLQHLLRTSGEEDLAFALWTPSHGAERTTALIHTVILPDDGDRQVHGNVSFNPQFFERVLERAASSGCGIAFLHSHLGPGWQGMSDDDVIAERRMAGAATTVTGVPLVGLTAGTDGTWSARMWFRAAGRRYDRTWCSSVRVVGARLSVSFNDDLVPPAKYREQFRRTRTVWGEAGHRHLARLRVGIVGLGSVGMAVAESLARSGIERFTLLDFDEVQTHNLDRLQGADNARDVGRLKISLARALIERSATAERVDVREIPYSIVEEAGYRAGLDCDVVFSCVDRPRARQILNHIAYAHLIPVIDGGIAVRFRDGRFVGAEWQAQTVAPGQPCLECLGAFDSGDVDTERNGLLEDPTYLQGLPRDHRLRQSENVYPFSVNLASMEVLHLVGLAGELPQVASFGAQRVHFVAGIMESDRSLKCRPGCGIDELVASGDSAFLLTGRDPAADTARARQATGSAPNAGAKTEE